MTPHVRALAAGCLLALSACAGPPAAAPPTLFDFETFDPAQLVQAEATGRVVEGLNGHALEFRSELGPQWPALVLRAPGGVWDLSGKIAITAELQNLADRPVRVLLSAEMPNSTGTDNCSIGSTTVAPGRRGTVTATFGEWHGQAKPFDPSRVASVRILLDRPTAPARFLIDDIKVVGFDRSAAEAAMQTEFFRQLQNPLGRGVNMGNMLEAPTEGAWGERLDEGYFPIIAAAGFTTIRLPVKWSAHAQPAAPYTLDEEWLARVDRAVAAALAAKLRVILDFHHYDEIMRDPQAHRERFVAIWEQLAEHYQEQPEEVWFELLNEPNGRLDGPTWNDFAAAAIEVIRPTNPTRPIVVGPPNWNAVDALPQLELPEADRHLVVTFHYYLPFQFTHQGAGWVGQAANQWLGTTWTGTDAEQRAVIRHFDSALEWAVQHQRPLFVGEFGAYSRADMESRARWTRFVADQAIARKMGFAYWEFCAGFGAWDKEQKAWREPLLNALMGK